MWSASSPGKDFNHTAATTTTLSVFASGSKESNSVECADSLWVEECIKYIVLVVGVNTGRLLWSCWVCLKEGECNLTFVFVTFAECDNYIFDP